MQEKTQGVVLQRQFFDCGYLYGHARDGVFYGKVAEIA